MIITLTQNPEKAPVLVDTREIGAIRTSKDGRAIIFIITDSGCYDHRIEVQETPAQISEAIVSNLLLAGEEIRVDE